MVGALRPTAMRRAGRVGGVFGVVVLLALVLSASARAAGEYEPNDSRETAYGPLAGGTLYTAGFETENDVDWYVFYIKAYSQMDFSVGLVKEGSCCRGTLVTLYDKDGEPVRSFYSGALNEVKHLYLTLGAGRYYLKVGSGNTGDRYKLRIDPATSLTTSRECGEAIVARESIVPLLADVNESLAKNAEALAPKTAAVHEAKKDLRHASKNAKRLRHKVKSLRDKVKRLRRHRGPARKLRRARARLSQVRAEVHSAVEAVDRAKERRQPVWEERVQLEAVAAQDQQEITGAEGQIAIHC